MSDTAVTEPIVRPTTRETTSTRRLPPYHVILFNDDHHTFEFVINVLRKVLSCTEPKAYQIAIEAHTRNRAIMWTGSKEVAELKVEQVLTFSETLSNGRKLGPLGVSIEPAE